VSVKLIVPDPTTTGLVYLATTVPLESAMVAHAEVVTL
jgi:hypothetical protein